MLYTFVIFKIYFLSYLFNLCKYKYIIIQTKNGSSIGLNLHKNVYASQLKKNNI